MTVAFRWFPAIALLLGTLSSTAFGANNHGVHFNVMKSATFQEPLEEDGPAEALEEVSADVDNLRSFEVDVDSDSIETGNEEALVSGSDDRIFLVSTNVRPPPFVVEEAEVPILDPELELRAEEEGMDEVDSAVLGRFAGIKRTPPGGGVKNKVSRSQELLEAARPITDVVQPLADHVHRELSPDQIASRLQDAGSQFEEVVGPALDFGTRVARPVVSIGSKVASPFVALGAKVAKPFVKIGTKVVKAGIVKAGVVTGLGAKKVGKVIKATGKAIKPVAKVAAVVAAPKAAAAPILAGNAMLPASMQEPEVSAEVPAENFDEEEAFVEEVVEEVIVDEEEGSPFQPLSDAFQPITDAVDGLRDAAQPFHDAVHNQGEEATFQGISSDVADLVGPGAKAAAPIVKKKAVLATPLVKLKAKVAFPFVKIGAKIAHLGRKKIVNPVRKGIENVRKFGNDLKKTIEEAEFNTGFSQFGSFSKEANGPLKFSASFSAGKGGQIGPFGGKDFELTGKESVAEALLVFDEKKNIVGIIDEVGNLRELSLVDQFGNFLGSAAALFSGGGGGKVNQPERQDQSNFDGNTGSESYSPRPCGGMQEQRSNHYHQEEVLSYDEGQGYHNRRVHDQQGPTMSHRIDDHVYTSSHHKESKYRPMKSYADAASYSDLFDHQVEYGDSSEGRYHGKRSVVDEEEYFMHGGSAAAESVVPELVLGSIRKSYGFPRRRHTGAAAAAPMQYDEVLTIIEEPARKFTYNPRQGNSLERPVSGHQNGQDETMYMHGGKIMVTEASTTASSTTTSPMTTTTTTTVAPTTTDTTSAPTTTTTEAPTTTPVPVLEVQTKMEQMEIGKPMSPSEESMSEIPSMEPEPMLAMEPEPMLAMEPEPMPAMEPEPMPAMEPEPMPAMEPMLAMEPEPIESMEVNAPPSPAAAAAPAPKCESELVSMRTSLCHRVEEYSITKCDDPSCAEMDVDLANLIRVCKTPSREQLCTMSAKTLLAQSSLAPASSSCKLYKFTFTRLLDFSPFCRHQLECVVDQHFCYKASKYS